jgi:hypothetical protein
MRAFLRPLADAVAAQKGARMRWSIGVCLGLLLCTMSLGYADDRRGSPFGDEHWEGYRTWKPDRRRGLVMPDRFTIDKRGKCEVRCQRVGREYKCREYRC